MPRRKKDKRGKEILTVREQLFVEGVAQGKSLTQAALDAGYSPEYAGQIGSENYKKLEIQANVQRRVQDVVKADTDEVLSVFAAHLRTDIADFDGCFQADGQLDLVEAKKRNVSRLVKKLKTRRVPVRNKDGEVLDYETVTELEFHDSQSAARTLADILGIKQQPRENEHDTDLRQRGRDEVLKLFADYVRACGGDEAKARTLLAEDAPTLSQWLN